MITLNINEAKTHLSEYLAKLKPGEKILLCKRNVPVAEIRALPNLRTKPRPIGLAKDRFQVPDTFFEPLPEDVIVEFDGRSK